METTSRSTIKQEAEVSFTPAEVSSWSDQAFATITVVDEPTPPLLRLRSERRREAGSSVDAKVELIGEPLVPPVASIDDLIIGDEIVGAEKTETYVAILRSVVDVDAPPVEPSILELDLALSVPTLEEWEVAAFREAGDVVNDCVQTMVAMRLKIARFDATARRAAGREAALGISNAYLAEVTRLQETTQGLINQLIRDAKVEEMHIVSRTRAKLMCTACELRRFVADVNREVTGDIDGAACDATMPLAVAAGEAPSSSVVAGPLFDVDVPAPGAVPPESSTHTGLTRTNKTGKVARPPTRTEREAQKKRSRRVARFVVSLLVFVATTLYFVLENSIEARYKDRLPEFAEFDAGRFQSIIPIESARRMRDAADVVVKREWRALSTDKKREKVMMLYNALRPGGVGQLFVFDQERVMVATAKDGAVAVIR